MRYHTVKPNLEFWHDYITWRTKWRPKFNLTQLASNLGFRVSYLSELLSQKYEGEISARFIATSIIVTGCSFEELYRLEEFRKLPNTEIPNKVNGQVFNTNGQDDSYLVKEARKLDFLMASSDFAERIGEGQKRTWYSDKKYLKKS